MTTKNTATTPKTRKFDGRKVVDIIEAEGHVWLDLGYKNPARLADGVYDGDISTSDLVSGNYHMASGPGGRPYAEITEVSAVAKPEVAAEPEPVAEEPVAEEAAAPSRVITAGVERVEAMRTGLKLHIGHDAPVYLARSVYEGEVQVGDEITIVARAEEGRDGARFLRAVEVSEIVSPIAEVQDAPADETEESPSPEAKAMELIVTAQGAMSKNNRFVGLTDAGERVVVKATGRSVMYARALVKVGALVQASGAYNEQVEGRHRYFDAYRVEKAA